MLIPVGIPIYSTLPDSSPNPFIFVGEIEVSEADMKSSFLLSASFVIELYTGTQDWTGSISQALSWVNSIKEIIQPTKSSVIDLSPDFQMTTLKLGYDTGLTAYSTTERLYVDRIQYETFINQN